MVALIVEVPAHGCSLQFTNPLRGSTVTTASVGVSGTGSGTANSGDVGSVTATVNGVVFFNQSGVFTTLIQFLGSGSAAVTLKAGLNLLQVSGSAGSCSASDQMVVYYAPPPPPAQKAAGAPLVCNGSNPIDGSNGNKFQAERDYTGAGTFPLVFERYYNSAFDTSHSFGPRWRSTYDRSIAGSGAKVYVLRPDGRALGFASSGTNWISDPDVTERLEQIWDGTGKPIGWKLHDSDDSVEIFDVSGRLSSITLRGGQSQVLEYDPAGRLGSVAETGSGRRLTFAYDGLNRLASMTDPAGGVVAYAYDSAGRLSSVTYPDDSPSDAADNPQRRYLYEDVRFPYALTGLIDESGVRFASWGYDAAGRAISSEHAGGVSRFGFLHKPDGSAAVTDPLGTTRTYTYQPLFGVSRNTAVSVPCASGCGTHAASMSYDANGNVTKETDFQGISTSHLYDLKRNLEISRTEAVATPAARTTTIEWHPQFRLPTRIVQAQRTALLSYDSGGRLVASTLRVGAKKRTWRFAYSSEGQLTSVDGPRTDVSDVTTYIYYPLNAICPDGHVAGCRGQLQSSRNALGHVTTFSGYDAHGRVGRIVDTNSLVQAFAYDARGRLVRKAFDGALTTFRYDQSGNLIRITSPDGAFQNFTYDAAHRLVEVSRRDGSRIHYTLDPAGHRVREDVYDAGNALVHARRWTYDALSRLVATTGASDQITTFSYDANGYPTGVLDPNNHSVTTSYDVLSRVVRVTDAQGGATDFQRDAFDQLIAVRDAEGLTTSYVYNGLGDRIQEMSPNTGKMTFTHDDAGNPLSRVDADGVSVKYSYDALNRLVAADFPGTEADLSFVWDTGPKQKGFLREARRGPYNVAFGYDRRGNVISVSRSKDGIPWAEAPLRYAYDKANRLVSIGYGDTRDVQYIYDLNGDISQVRMVDHKIPGDPSGDVSSIVANRIVRLPFGPIKSLAYGNGLTLRRTFDLDYRLTSQSVSTLHRLGYAYDAGGNLTGITDGVNQSVNQSFIYDDLDRLTRSNGIYGDLGYSYDAIGNRLSHTLNGQVSMYAYGQSNHQLLSVNGSSLQAYEYSASGNTLKSGNLALGYGPDGRLASARRGKRLLATYGYDAFGQRVEKFAGGARSLFQYDRNGNLLREAGRDYIHIDSELLAVAEGADLFYIHSNHLGAPLLATARSKQTVWAAAYEPFGKALLTNPGMVLNLRLPGQYFDQETGLHYNYFRDYDPAIGRYIQSDPIGLSGGINTYAYVGNNPVNAIDPTGQAPFLAFLPVANYLGGAILGGLTSATLQYGVSGNVDVNQTVDDAIFGGLLGLVSPALGTAVSLRSGNGAVAACSTGKGVLATRSIATYHPNSDGFLGSGRDFTLIPRARVDRYGFDGGRFLAPEGTPVPMRSLPPGAVDRPYSVFEVLKPLNVRAGETAPAYGQIGLGTQFVTSESMRELVAQGLLKRISP